MRQPFTPLSGKVALVTGGSRGIGAAVSRKLAAWGSDLYINYVERDRPAQELKQELERAGARIALAKADVTERADVDRLFGAVEQGHGHLDILVHNAAAAVFGAVADFDDNKLRFTLDSNVRALVLLAQRARPLLAGRSARLITLSNPNAVSHGPRNGVFGAAKAAVESLTRSLADELAPDGVVVNCVRPGAVAQTGVLSVRPDIEALLDLERRESPWKRNTLPEDVGNVVAMLCLDEASWVCGQTIVVDGGWLRYR